MPDHAEQFGDRPGGVQGSALVGTLRDVRLRDVSADRRERWKDVTKYGQPESARVRGVDRRVHQAEAGDSATVAGREQQRQPATHRQTTDEGALALRAEVVERALHRLVPVLPSGLVQLLPGRTVTGQPWHRHSEPVALELVGPGPHRRRIAGEPVEQAAPRAGRTRPGTARPRAGPARNRPQRRTGRGSDGWTAPATIAGCRWGAGAATLPARSSPPHARRRRAVAPSVRARAVGSPPSEGSHGQRADTKVWATGGLRCSTGS